MPRQVGERIRHSSLATQRQPARTETTTEDYDKVGSLHHQPTTSETGRYDGSGIHRMEMEVLSEGTKGQYTITNTQNKGDRSKVKAQVVHCSWKLMKVQF